MKNKKAIVLLSGGLDSATCLYFAKKSGYACRGLIFNYNQRHKKEIAQALKIAKKASIPFYLLNIRLPWKGSALLDKKIRLPKRKSNAGIPSTYVPARNTLFLSYALSCAESTGAEAVFIGANSIDYSGYPDCRPEYLRSFQKTAKLATKAGTLGKKIKIHAPLLRMNKARIVKLALRLKVPLELTWSCYKGARKPCGVCDSCVLRAKGFRQAGAPDPAA